MPFLFERFEQGIGPSRSVAVVSSCVRRQYTVREIAIASDDDVAVAAAFAPRSSSLEPSPVSHGTMAFLHYYGSW